MRFTPSHCKDKYDEMAKTYSDLLTAIREWSLDPTLKGGHGTSTQLSLRTGKADKAKKPSVRQLKNLSPDRKEIQALKNKNWSSGGIT